MFLFSSCVLFFLFFFFLNDPAPPEISPLSLHAALPICRRSRGPEPAPPPPARTSRAIRNRPGRTGSPPRPAERRPRRVCGRPCSERSQRSSRDLDRKSTRLNSSHGYISYAVFCLKKKKT